MRALSDERWTHHVHPSLQRQDFYLDAEQRVLTNDVIAFPLEATVRWGNNTADSPALFFTDARFLRPDTVEVLYRPDLDLLVRLSFGPYTIVGIVSRRSSFNEWQLLTAYNDESDGDDERPDLVPALGEEPVWYADWQKEHHP